MIVTKSINNNNKNEDCANCKEFILKTQKVSYTVHKDPIEFSVDLLFCKPCNKPCPTEENLNNIRKRAVELYCEKHGLLTAKDLIKIRQDLGFSQREFCKYMNIGIASLSFWENSVRPIAKAANSLIRFKMAPDYLENHKQEIEEIRQSFKKPSYKLQFV